MFNLIKALTFNSLLSLRRRIRLFFGIHGWAIPRCGTGEKSEILLIWKILMKKEIY